MRFSFGDSFAIPSDDSLGFGGKNIFVLLASVFRQLGLLLGDFLLESGDEECFVISLLLEFSNMGVVINSVTGVLQGGETSPSGIDLAVGVGHLLNCDVEVLENSLEFLLICNSKKVALDTLLFLPQSLNLAIKLVGQDLGVLNLSIQSGLLLVKGCEG